MEGLVGAIECATEQYRAVLTGARTQINGDWVPLDVPVPLIEQDIAEVVQDIPPERDQKRIAAQRVNIPMLPIMASPLVLARDEPAENPEESRLQGRGLRERPEPGDDETLMPSRYPRIPAHVRRGTVACVEACAAQKSG